VARVGFAAAVAKLATQREHGAELDSCARSRPAADRARRGRDRYTRDHDGPPPDDGYADTLPLPFRPPAAQLAIAA